MNYSKRYLKHKRDWKRNIIATHFELCWWCGEPHKRNKFGNIKLSGVILHHLIPRRVGGADVTGNVRPVHNKCHREIHQTIDGLPEFA